MQEIQKMNYHLYLNHLIKIKVEGALKLIKKSMPTDYIPPSDDSFKSTSDIDRKVLNFLGNVTT